MSAAPPTTTPKQAPKKDIAHSTRKTREEFPFAFLKLRNIQLHEPVIKRSTWSSSFVALSSKPAAAENKTNEIVVQNCGLSGLFDEYSVIPIQDITNEV